MVHEGSLADAVDTYVTGPLGMDDSSFVVGDPERLAVPYADGDPRAVRMGEPHRVDDLVFSPVRAFDERSLSRAVAAWSAPPATSCASWRPGDWVERRSSLRHRRGSFPQPGGRPAGAGRAGLGVRVHLRGAARPATSGSPSSAGTLSWGGVYGHTWFLDRAAALSMVSLTNTALEGNTGASAMTFEPRSTPALAQPCETASGLAAGSRGRAVKRTSGGGPRGLASCVERFVGRTRVGRGQRGWDAGPDGERARRGPEAWWTGLLKRWRRFESCRGHELDQRLFQRVTAVTVSRAAPVPPVSHHGGTTPPLGRTLRRLDRDQSDR